MSEVPDYRHLKSEASTATSGFPSDGALGSQYTFLRGTVLEFISNPVKFLNKSVYNTSVKPPKLIGKMKDLLVFDQEDNKKNTPIVSNYEISQYMPLNSIMCYIGNLPGSERSPIIAFPFFSQHFCLPLKPGEDVMLLEEKNGTASTYYWMTRTSTIRQCDDLNYTILDRSPSIRDAYSKFIVEGALSEDDPFLVACLDKSKSNYSRLPHHVDNDKICASSFSYLEDFTTEPVPRKFAPGSDMLLQGSNNTLIHMTVEKFANISEEKAKIFTDSKAKQLKSNIRKPMAGAIDLVVGRDKSRLSKLSKEEDPESISENEKLNVKLNYGNRGNNALKFYELDKIDQFQGRDENTFEGLDSPRAVFARMYVSMNASPDESFQMPNIDFEEQQGSSVVNYADLCRTYAEKNIRLCNLKGNSVIEMDEEGNIHLQSGEGPEAARIILKSSGNIILKPGTGGLLYLGGDETNTTLAVCGAPSPRAGGTAGPNTPLIDSFGGVSFDPISSASGIVSSKVVLKA